MTARPLQEVAAESDGLAAPRRALVACLSLLSAALLAGTPEQAANLSACKNGWTTCERSRLTPVESRQVAVTEHARHLANCRNGLGLCHQAQLTEAEAIGVAVAAYERNVSTCTAGYNPCDPHAALTPSEAREVARAGRQRNYWPAEAGAIPPEVR